MGAKEELDGSVYFVFGEDQYVKRFPTTVDAPFIVDDDGVYRTSSEDGELLYAVSREDGPAIITGDSTLYVFEGRLHRIDGPALQSKYGDREYFLLGIGVSESEHGTYADFARRAADCLMRNHIALTEFDVFGKYGSGGVCESFQDFKSFHEAYLRNALLVYTGPRDNRQYKWVDIDATPSKSGIATGLVAAGAIGILGVAAAKISKHRKQKTQVQIPIEQKI